MTDLKETDIVIKNLFLPDYLKKIVIDTGDWSFTKEQAEFLKDRILENQETRKKYNDIALLFVLWNERNLTDQEFTQRAILVLGDDYRKLSDETAQNTGSS